MMQFERQVEVTVDVDAEDVADAILARDLSLTQILANIPDDGSETACAEAAALLPTRLSGSEFHQQGYGLIRALAARLDELEGAS